MPLLAPWRLLDCSGGPSTGASRRPAVASGFDTDRTGPCAGSAWQVWRGLGRFELGLCLARATAALADGIGKNNSEVRARALADQMVDSLRGGSGLTAILEADQ